MALNTANLLLAIIMVLTVLTEIVDNIENISSKSFTMLNWYTSTSLISCLISLPPPSLVGSAEQVMALPARHDTTSSCRPHSLPIYSLMNANGECGPCMLGWRVRYGGGGRGGGSWGGG